MECTFTSPARTEWGMFVMSGVLMKSFGEQSFYDRILGVNHMRGMHYKIVINIAICPEL